MPRRALTREERAELNALRVAAPDLPESEHFFTCKRCGQRVDYRRLGDVLYHDEPHDRPLFVEENPWQAKFIEPMQPTLVDVPPASSDWQHEIKYDGYRTQIHLFHGDGRAFTRNGHDWTHLYGFLIEDALHFPCESAIIDGEVIIQDEQGRCDFYGLRRAIQKEPDRLVFMAFDLLELDGENLRRKPLERRRELLARLVGPNVPTSPIQFSQHVTADAADFLQAVEMLGLEGIVSKRLGSRYRSGKTNDWLKIKCFKEEELIVVGVETGKGPSVALLAREVDGALTYAGGAMVTLPQRERDRFWAAIDAMEVTKPPVPMKKRSGAKWVRPVMRVRVRTLSGEEKLRHATVLGIVNER